MIREALELMRLLCSLMVAVLATLVVFSVLFVAVYVVVDPRVCSERWEDRARWGFWSGCLVETNRGYLPQGVIRGVDIGVEVLK